MTHLYGLKLRTPNAEAGAIAKEVFESIQRSDNSLYWYSGLTVWANGTKLDSRAEFPFLDEHNFYLPLMANNITGVLGVWGCVLNPKKKDMALYKGLDSETKQSYMLPYSLQGSGLSVANAGILDDELDLGEKVAELRKLVHGGLESGLLLQKDYKGEESAFISTADLLGLVSVFRALERANINCIVEGYDILALYSQWPGHPLYWSETKDYAVASDVLSAVMRTNEMLGANPVRSILSFKESLFFLQHKTVRHEFGNFIRYVRHPIGYRFFTNTEHYETERTAWRPK